MSCKFLFEGTDWQGTKIKVTLFLDNIPEINVKSRMSHGMRTERKKKSKGLTTSFSACMPSKQRSLIFLSIYQYTMTSDPAIGCNSLHNILKKWRNIEKIYSVFNLDTGSNAKVCKTIEVKHHLFPRKGSIKDTELFRF